ncbi:3-isopropylmalate dehydratase, large subunit, partial [mine drainage metagenome]
MGHIGTAGGTGYAIEFAGEAIRGLSMEGRMTLCNMAIEAGARAGLIGADDVTFAYLKGRPYAPSDAQWGQAVTYWRTLHSDEGAVFDKEVTLSAQHIEPLVTWGTSPEMVVSVTGQVPDPPSGKGPGASPEHGTGLDLHGADRQYAHDPNFSGQGV